MAEHLRRAILERLDLLDQIADRGDAGVLLPLARAELHRLAEGWRMLLTVHQPDEDGRCRTCPPGLRRRRWPCQVWLMAHQHLIGETLPTRAEARLASPFHRRSADVVLSEARTVTLPPVTVQQIQTSSSGAPQVTELPPITDLTLVTGVPARREQPGEPAREHVHRAPVAERPPHLPRLRAHRPDHQAPTR